MATAGKRAEPFSARQQKFMASAVKRRDKFTGMVDVKAALKNLDAR
jgi:hypothetical protein